MPHSNKGKVLQHNSHIEKNVEEEADQQFQPDHYKQLLDNMKNAVYEIKKEDDQFYCSAVFGDLSDQLHFTKTDQYDQQLRTLFKEKISLAFLGEETVFTFHFKHSFLHTTLKPIYKGTEVEKLIGTTMDITPFENSEKTMEYLVTHDVLTGLPNRHKLLEDLKKQLESTTEKDPASVIIVDLDRLKNVNDTLGQLAGDKVISLMSDRIKKLMDNGCPMYRLGGDEFVIIINDRHTDTRVLTENILHDVRQPVTVYNHDFYMTATVGIALKDEETQIQAEEFVNQASVSVHYGKIEGGNRVCVYTNQMSKKYSEILLLETDIHKAFELKEFSLHYQPKVDVNTNRIVGVEALIRWSHGKKGNIPPSVFIPIAEDIGLINRIGEWVLREACTQFVTWRKSGVSPIMVAVNISAVELQQPAFLSTVKNIIQETGMDPHYLEIEITENSVMQNTESCIQMMNELRKMGISLSIDDFGTGYSSMGYLRKFPINYLKIDKSFIQELYTETGSAEIIKAMIQLGHTFDLKVVAEGVEEEQNLSFIKQQKCDYYQGYLYSRPVEADKMQEKLLAYN